MDLFFMNLTFMKRGGTWDDIAFAFRQKKNTLEKSLNIIIDKDSPIFFKTFVKNRACE